MRYKLLGRSGLRVSELCLGTMSIGERWGFGADRHEARRILDTYAQAGGNFIDTANKYHEGHSEEIIGDIISGDRHRWVLATKYTLAMGTGDPNAAGNSRKNMMRSVHDSLRRLRTDCFDLLWVHAWDFVTPVEEVMRGLDDLVRSGKVLYVGVSDTPAWVVAQANTLASLQGWTPFVGLQVQYSLIERTVERELLPMAHALGLGVAAWAPIAGGVLSGKYTRNGSAAVDSKRAEMNAPRLTPHNLSVARTVDTIADQLGTTSAQVAIAWVRQRSSNIVPIVGARTHAQLADLLGAMHLQLSREHMQQLDQVSGIPLGFPHDFLSLPHIRQLVYGDQEANIDLPPNV